jgi:hypothetical protein
MPSLLERNQAILDRIQNPQGITENLRAFFLDSKRRQLLHGVDENGVPFAPLADSTLKRRHGNGPPLAPQGESSEIITRMQVTVTPEPHQVQVTIRWPGLDWVKYHVTGGRHLPKRNPAGFSQDDKKEALRRFRDWIFER